MKTQYKQRLLKSLSLFLVVVLLSSSMPVIGMAAENDDPIVVVSLGDSYSSGEGITPFFGQDLPLEEKVWNEDWLAHRSTNSWPSRLYVPGMPEGTTLGDYRDASNADVQWYFGAVSGATTHHFWDERQPKPFCVKAPGFLSGFWVPAEEDIPYMPLQKDIFSKIPEGVDVDYVTLTVGGNDVDFTGIVKQTVHPGAIYTPLKAKFKDLWKNIKTHEENLENLYRNINTITQGKADIIVAGYPELFNKDGKGLVIAKQEATIINENVIKFNQSVISTIIQKLQKENIKIHFVDVAPAFAADGGHQAYSSDQWINKIDFTPNDQDLDQKAIGSHYSVHPNSQGAQAYADLVNAKIAEIENAGTLTGKICKASDRITPVTNATIQIIKDGSTKTLTPDSNGNYSVELPVGTYLVKVTADGYIEFNAFATIESRQEVFMETFLMVEGEETDIGEAIGTITNALTGNGVEGVTLDVRSGWNNTDSGDILTTVTTNASGDYTVTLPIGNYTLCASKAGYISTTINVVVQPNMCTTKNASMTPIISGDNFRIVLTWGASPSDLDSHVVGTLSSGSSFHVYYSDKSEYDGDVEVCNLDVDDTSSYGPETITLNTVTNEPYYYYIYNYSSSTGMITSEAQIKVYQGENLVATFNVPTNQADARYWNVFAIVNGELIVSNTITSSADLSYAGNASNASVMTIDVEADIAKSTE